MITILVYLPLINIGRSLQLLKLGHLAPLYETYADKSIWRIRQDVYDRFFTGIEQRYTRQEIMTLEDKFGEVVVSDGIPYWHFMCNR
jgi:hypothetical protein